MVKVYDMFGRQALYKEVSLHARSNIVALNGIRDLKKGLYIWGTVTGDTESEAKSEKNQIGVLTEHKGG